MRKLDESKKDFLDKAVKFSKYTVQTDKLDIRFFEEVKNNNPQIKKTIEDAQGDYEPFPELQQDIFSSLYRYKPHLLKETQVESDHLLNWHVMKEIMESPKYKELRANTRLDRINSTVGTEILGDEAAKIVKKLKEQQEKQDEVNEAQQQLNKAKNQQGQQKAGGADDGISVKEAQRRLEAARKELGQSMKKKEVVNEIRKSLNKTQDAVTETSDMIQNWGLGGDNTFTSMPYQEKMQLLQRLRNSDKLKRIAQLAGRFKRIATQRQREKVKKGLDEIYDLSLGNEIGRLIPQELMKLRHPVTKRLFYKDYAEKNLLQYELRGKEKKHKGPIICCIDNSGSMSGDPEVWKYLLTN